MNHINGQQLRDIYASTHTIAVVGASADPAKIAHQIPRYLHDQGYRVLPVSPRAGELFGEAVRTSLADVPGPVDVDDVFRPPAEAASIPRQAIAPGAPALWFQPGT